MMQINGLVNMTFVDRSQLSQRAFIVSNNQRCAVAKRDRAEFYGIEAKFYFFHESADRLNYFRKGKDSALARCEASLPW